MAIDSVPICRAAAMGDPDARAGAQDRFDRGDEAAGRVHDFDLTVVLALVDVRLAVGEHHDPFAREVADQGLVEALGAPDAGLAILFALCRDLFDQLPHVVDDRCETVVVGLAEHEAP